jgi:hypothetical protein
MAVNLSPVLGVAGQFFDNNGNPLAGGKIFTYAAGTTTNQATYTSATGLIAHSNPIILDAAGRVPSGEIWLTDGLSYKFVIKTSLDTLIGSFDNLVGINSNFINFLTEVEIQTATAGQTVFTLTTMEYQPNTNSLTVYVDGVNQYDGVTYAYTETSSTVVTFTAGLHVGALVKFTTAQTLSSGVTDSSLVTYDPAGVGAVPTNVQTKLRELVTRQDYDTDANVNTNLIPWELGFGDLQQIYTSTDGQILDIRKGSTAIPDTVTEPIVKAQRYIDILSSAITGDGGEQMASIYGISAGTTTNEAQPVGVYGGAVSQYSSSGAGKGDACGVYGAARFTGSGVGTAIGAFFTGRRDTSTGRATAAEFTTQNYSGVDSTYTPSGYSSGIGLWINALGNADSGVGISFGNPFGQQFEVGIGFSDQVVGGKTGAVSGTTFYDSGSSTTSLFIQGTHTTALGIGATAGNVVIGASGPASAGVKLAVTSTSDSQSIAILRAHSATPSADLFRVEDYLGSTLFYIDPTGGVVMSNLPTSPGGLPSGALYRTGTTVSIVP